MINSGVTRRNIDIRGENKRENSNENYSGSWENFRPKEKHSLPPFYRQGWRLFSGCSAKEQHKEKTGTEHPIYVVIVIFPDFQWNTEGGYNVANASSNIKTAVAVGKNNGLLLAEEKSFQSSTQTE